MTSDGNERAAGRWRPTFRRGASSGSVLEDVLGNELDGQHGLSTGWLYLRFRQEKAKPALVSELEGKRVFDAQVVSPV